MRNPDAYCNRCNGIIAETLRSSYVCTVCAKREECSSGELYALLETILARAESPVYRTFELSFPTICTQNDVIRRMYRTLQDIAADIHQVIDRKAKL